MSYAHRILSLCRGCAHEFYDTVPPNEKYAHSVTMLLFGTAIQESRLVWERQKSLPFLSKIGGFSKWQMEKASIRASLEDIKKRPGLLRQTTKWLFNDPNADDELEWIDHLDIDTVLWLMRLDDNDKIGVWFCRAHYRRRPEPIPSDIQSIAEYWKRWYNTYQGKGTVNEFLENYHATCNRFGIDSVSLT